MTCHITGPYFPVGDLDWQCKTHKVRAVLMDPSRYGAKDLRREDFRCPADPPEGWYFFGTHTNGGLDGIRLVFSEQVGDDGLPVWERLEPELTETALRRKVGDEIERERRALPDHVPHTLGAAYARSGDDCSWAMAHARDIAIYGLHSNSFAVRYSGGDATTEGRPEHDY